MNIKVNAHKIEIETTPVNEREVKITKCYFEFAEEMQDLTKEAYFTLKDNTYKVLIQNDECEIPNEVLVENGTIELGVVCFEVQEEETLKRYNPSPVYFRSWVGSLKDNAENSEPITPTDKEQIEQQLQNISTQMDNIDVEAEKVEHTTTITITRKDGTSYDVQVLDGEKGEKGDKGEAGAIKILIVNELPSVGADDTIYLVPLENPDVQGNNYAEYIYINGQWELLGKIGVQVDLTDYYTKTETNTLLDNKVGFTDYASSSKAGVIRTTRNFGTDTSGEFILGYTQSYNYYTSADNRLIISKGTLENVITGKDLTTKSYVDGLVGDIASAIDLINGESI